MHVIITQDVMLLRNFTDLKSRFALVFLDMSDIHYFLIKTHPFGWS